MCLGCNSPTPRSGHLGSAKKVGGGGEMAINQSSKKVPLSKRSETRVDPKDPVACPEPEY